MFSNATHEIVYSCEQTAFRQSMDPETWVWGIAPEMCHIMRVPTKMLNIMKAAVCSFLSQSSTFLFFKIKTPTVRPTMAPNAWPNRETSLMVS